MIFVVPAVLFVMIMKPAFRGSDAAARALYPGLSSEWAMTSPAFMCSIAHRFTLLTASTLIIGVLAPTATFCLSAGSRGRPTDSTVPAAWMLSWSSVGVAFDGQGPGAEALE